MLNELEFQFKKNNIYCLSFLLSICISQMLVSFFQVYYCLGISIQFLLLESRIVSLLS